MNPASNHPENALPDNPSLTFQHQHSLASQTPGSHAMQEHYRSPSYMHVEPSGNTWQDVTPPVGSQDDQAFVSWYEYPYTSTEGGRYIPEVPTNPPSQWSYTPWSEPPALSRADLIAKASKKPEIWQCLKCPSHFTRSADLQRHLNTVHCPLRVQYDCPKRFCGRTGDNGFSRKDHLKEHMRQYHKEAVPRRRSG